MELKDVQANQGNLDLVLVIKEKEDPRTFEKFGKQGKVCNTKVIDDTGEMKLTLWNDDIDKVNIGDKIHLQNGWCSEYKGEKQLSTGKFGKIELVEAGKQEVFTNDPGLAAGGVANGLDESEERGEEVFDEEEFVE